MPYKPREIESMLKTKLLAKEEVDADHKWFRIDVDGLPPIWTKLSHNNKEIRDVLEKRIFNQLRVRKGFFHELMDCTKYRTDYEEQIRRDPYPPFTQLLV